MRPAARAPWPGARSASRPAPLSSANVQDRHVRDQPGHIVAELYDKDAPKTVANFEKLANDGFYDGVKFHRVIPDFVVQGGDPLSRDLPDGRSADRHRRARLTRSSARPPATRTSTRWVRCPWRTPGKDTGGSQFFMVLSEQNTRHLNGVHTVFGKITEGLDVMRQLQQNDAMTSVRVA